MAKPFDHRVGNHNACLVHRHLSRLFDDIMKDLGNYTLISAHILHPVIYPSCRYVGLTNNL